MSPGAITVDHDATKPAWNGDSLKIEVGGDRSCSIVIGSRLAAIRAAPLDVLSTNYLGCGRPIGDTAGRARACGLVSDAAAGGPYTETPAADIARARPTAKWQIIGKFDSAAQCVRQLKQLMIKTQSAYDAIPVNPAQHSVCIESGDGGLMGN